MGTVPANWLLLLVVLNGWISKNQHEVVIVDCPHFVSEIVGMGTVPVDCSSVISGLKCVNK